MSTEVPSVLRPSYLYVPTSSDRMLGKSLSSPSDVIIYDLEDGVPPLPADKSNARERLKDFLGGRNFLDPRRIAVRINDITTPYFQDDIAQIASSPAVQTLVLPKIHSPQDLHHVSREIYLASQKTPRQVPLNIVSSVESARASFNLGGIAGWKSEYGMEGGRLTALLFAAEDYCADTSIIRSPTRQELLYTRSQIVIVAKAFGLDAIDMVCVNYKDFDILRDECHEGRRLGFTGKQAIHPAQVEIIQSAFAPTSEEILRAAKIIHGLELAHSQAKGAVGLEGEMIDAPMLKQAEHTIKIARAAGLHIPVIAA
ncbi:Citrate lyase subunit beta-like protein, mitochondrial [Hypsizygus marmoreus]|uniref:Citrate lyase subunit beta-like protein, mitochondrial n=1 Tax=Hypsizygus marmoreus TaxID=39966 RepID=A0A369J703_HYPMA|nr:Citrate lyase subunit beta-like protein, mitochondrial [Hypsizygus marmoreus]